MEGDFATVPIRKLSSITAMSSLNRDWRFLRISVRLILVSFIYEYLYSYYLIKKMPTSQENCGHVIKKVLKGLNCYIKTVVDFSVRSTLLKKVFEFSTMERHGEASEN